MTCDQSQLLEGMHRSYSSPFYPMTVSIGYLQYHPLVRELALERLGGVAADRSQPTFNLISGDTLVNRIRSP